MPSSAARTLVRGFARRGIEVDVDAACPTGSAQSAFILPAIEKTGRYLATTQIPGSKKRKLPAVPTIAEATRWIAELRGWIGPANGPPGAMTLARGM